MEIATYIITFATVIYMGASLLLWKTTRDSLNLNRRIFESSYRPFIGFESCNIHFTDDGFVNPFIKYHNFGNLPAKDVTISVTYLLNNLENGSKQIGSHEYAGRVIGMLKRMLIYFFVLISEITVIGFIVAAKGFTKFKELDKRDFAEYVLIGTLLSLFSVLVISFLIKKIPLQIF